MTIIITECVKFNYKIGYGRVTICVCSHKTELGEQGSTFYINQKRGLIFV